MTRTGQKRNAYSVFIRKPEEREPIRRYRFRSEYDIKINIKATWEAVGWFRVA